MARLQVGSESFRKIRENDLCYVDKTSFLEEFLCSLFVKVSLITRPRRFGKTLMMSMLYNFFDIRQDSKAFKFLIDSPSVDKNDRKKNSLHLKQKSVAIDDLTKNSAEAGRILWSMINRTSVLPLLR